MIQKIKINDFSLAVRIEGESKKGDIMLIHCLGISHRVFEHQIDFLVKSGFRVVAPDVRCHGDSDKVDKECTLWDLAEDMFRVLDKLGIKSLFALGGISMGGMISMRMMIKKPEIARKLILMGTSADEDPYKERYIPLLENMLSIAQNEKDPEKLKEAFRNSAEFVVRICFSQNYLEKENNFEKWVAESMKAQSLGAIYVSKAVIMRESILDKLGDIKVPTLVMAGSNDMAVPVSEAKKIAERIKNSKLVILENAPHIFLPEVPEKANKEISDFISA